MYAQSSLTFRHVEIFSLIESDIIENPTYVNEKWSPQFVISLDVKKVLQPCKTVFSKWFFIYNPQMFEYL